MIRMEEKNYEKLKKQCKKIGCFCPPEYEVRAKEANSSVWLRLWFKIKT